MALRTKNAIRRSFIELLAERPFDKISVRDIAERSEVTRNTFYYYYTDIYALAEDFDGDVFFPDVPPEDWDEISRTARHGTSGPVFSFVTYRRR